MFRVDDVGGKPFGRDFEGRPCPGRILEEKIEYAFAAHQGNFLDFPVGDADERGSGVQNVGQDFFRQAMQSQQVPELAVAV